LQFAVVERLSACVLQCRAFVRDNYGFTFSKPRRRLVAGSAFRCQDIPLDISPHELGPSKSWALAITILVNLHHLQNLWSSPLSSSLSAVKTSTVIHHHARPPKPRPHRPTVRGSSLYQSHPPTVVPATEGSFPASMGCTNSQTHSFFPHVSSEETRQRWYVSKTPRVEPG
jgi:hypothetical protein